MKKMATLAIAAMLGHSAAVMAIPAYPARKTVQMADGTTVTLTLQGDEHMHYYRAQDGTPWTMLADGTFRRIQDAEMALMKQSAQQTAQQARSRHMAKAQHRAPLVGKKKGLVVLVNFIDNKFSVDNPQATFNDFFNKTGYTDHGMTGSVSDYFKAQSYGQFELDFDVVGPYKLSKSMGYYGGASGNSHDSDPQTMIEEAVKAANLDVNFQDYDWDGDGWVDQVFVIYAGYGENYGASTNTVWPHESSISYKGVKLDGVNIGTYACSCELKGTEGTTLDGIGAACHEFSHCLGIMDHYDTQGSNFGSGPWDLMCSGSYNDNSCTPAAYTAYERWVNGWLTPTEITEGTEVKNMKPLTDAPEAYVIYNEANRNEYYLLENRQQRGFDAALYGHGLLVFHVDYDKGAWNANSINVGDVQHMSIIAADGEYGDYYASSLAGDPFPGTKGVTNLNDFTKPAAVLNNANADGAKLLHRGIERIVENADGTISMLVGRPNLQIPQFQEPSVTTDGFAISWNAVEGAQEYELTITEISPKADLKDACFLEENFEKCYKSSAGFTDISSSLNNYLSISGFTGSKLYQTPDLLRIGTSTTAGYLHTPVINQKYLSTGELTIEMDVKPLKEGNKVSGNVNLVTNTPATHATMPFEFTTATKLVMTPDVMLNELFRVDIEPANGMYLTHFALYDGRYTAEDFANNSRAAVKRRISVQTQTVKGTSCQFNGLNPVNTYVLRIRAIGDGVRQSNWSDDYTVLLDRTPVAAPLAGQSSDAAYYDLQGRRVAKPTRGIYIHDGKKVMVK